MTAPPRRPVRDPQVASGIRRIRIEHGWSLTESAARLRLDPSVVSRIENGRRPAPDAAAAAALLGVSPDYLLLPCPRCAYRPPRGYLCLRCGTQAPAARDPAWQ
jgi:transcriptional regulator with XRE-family HTH domain